MSSDTRLDSPVLYEFQLNENSTRYETPRAQLSEDDLQIQFAVLAAINAVVSFACLVLILGILRSRQVRSSPFNLYLLFMAIPDFLGAFFCLWTCALSAPLAKYYSESMCGFQAFYLVFAFCGNAWINAVIAHEVKKLLSASKQRKRYFPPRRHQVFCHVAMVYTYAFLWGIIAAFPIPGMPFQSKAYHGYACFPMEQDEASAYFFYLAFLPAVIIFPCLYSFYVMGRILCMGLIPRAGRRRSVSRFLLRLIVVYFVGWLPFVILGFILPNFVHVGAWVNWVGAALSHFQGFLSSIVVFGSNQRIREQMKLVLRGDLFEKEPSADAFFASMSERNNNRNNNNNNNTNNNYYGGWRAGFGGSVGGGGGRVLMSSSQDDSGTFDTLGQSSSFRNVLKSASDASVENSRRVSFDGMNSIELGVLKEVSKEIEPSDNDMTVPTSTGTPKEEMQKEQQANVAAGDSSVPQQRQEEEEEEVHHDIANQANDGIDVEIAAVDENS